MVIAPAIVVATIGTLFGYGATEGVGHPLGKVEMCQAKVYVEGNPFPIYAEKPCDDVKPSERINPENPTITVAKKK
ncbi:hypothetical protein P0C28_11285 [Aeromonas hydrophila]|uniref:hypothetical protein n=1 Tax=Aeromonas hydrophila TaxID=644 RepID=UPI0023AF7E7C|nr:hypothetical protein [Aeromonas hydrophila]MDE8809837.1 hypothetical protein [Aeromonas hydrophila]